MKTRWKVQGLLILVLALGCYGDGEVDISIDVDVVKVSGFQNPCELTTCPDGQTCTVVYHSEVLGVPVARCTQTDTQTHKEADSTPCIQFKLGSNVMRCKTEREWKKIGNNQCSIKQGKRAPLLTNSQVEHACHSFDGSKEPVFLQAHFTCCPRLPDSTTTVKEKTHVEEQIQTEVGGENEVTEGKHYIILYPSVIAMAIIMAIIFIVVAVWQRRRSKRSRVKHTKMITATSFVNPSADHEATPTYNIWDEYNGRSDKSVLLINEHTEFTPGN